MSGQDALLATKLHVPRPQPGFVPRPRLEQALSEGLARGRALICAPAGFGKTSLLADWARSGGRPVAWLGLDAGDNDPARFWRYVVAALDQAQPGIAGRLGALLGPPAPRSFEGLVTALINEFAAQPGPDEVLLVLDDYHLVDAGPAGLTRRCRWRGCGPAASWLSCAPPSSVSPPRRRRRCWARRRGRSCLTLWW
jgi:LuxR family maltose regulon positive regulatory protein